MLDFRSICKGMRLESRWISFLISSLKLSNRTYLLICIIWLSKWETIIISKQWPKWEDYNAPPVPSFMLCDWSTCPELEKSMGTNFVIGRLWWELQQILEQLLFFISSEFRDLIWEGLMWCIGKYITSLFQHHYTSLQIRWVWLRLCFQGFTRSTNVTCHYFNEYKWNKP